MTKIVACSFAAAAILAGLAMMGNSAASTEPGTLRVHAARGATPALAALHPASGRPALARGAAAGNASTPDVTLRTLRSRGPGSL